ncbi:MAG TPA: response regulator [Caulobacteraceae bacterium]|nr:response regulator [Caulobacteraceae bacterium]
MNGLHQPLYVALSMASALVGSWTALDLFGRVHANIGRARSAWLAAAAVALGLSVWAADFEAMLGFHPGLPERYDPALVALSLAVAVGGAGLSLYLASLRRGELGPAAASGLILGGAICLTHFVGLTAMRTAPVLGFQPAMLVLALLAAALGAGAGLMAADRDDEGLKMRAYAVLALSFAIVGGHYASIAASRFQPDGAGWIDGVDSSALAYSVAGGAVFVLFLASIAALFDRRFEALAAIEAKRNETQLRAILEQTPVGIIVADAPSGEIRFANSEAAHLLGHALVGQPISSENAAYGAIDDQGRLRSVESSPLMRAVRRGYRTERTIQRYRRPDGSVVMLEVAAAPIRDADGRVVQGATTFHDVTAKLKAEEALRQSQRMEGIGQLTGGVAHDFNNVLTAVLGNLSLAVRRVTDDKARDQIENAMQAAERGAKLISQLLAFSRRQRLQAQPVDLNAMIERLGGLFSGTLGGMVKVEHELADRLPLAKADPAQLELALLNLALNARDAMPRGGVLHLSTGVATLGAPRGPIEPEAGRYVAVTVADSGPGMTAEVAERAFEPFFTTKAQGRGSGLGLSQVLGLAKQLGGGVRLETAEGDGVAVTIYLPISDGVAPAEPVADDIPRAADGAKVLVVDDDPDVRRFVVDLLADAGYTVASAEDGPAGLRTLGDQGPFDLLLLDFAMPGMTGTEVARSVRERHPKQPILMMTGYLEHEAVLSELGAQPMLQKPFDPSDLLFRVSGLVERG